MIMLVGLLCEYGYLCGIWTICGMLSCLPIAISRAPWIHPAMDSRNRFQDSNLRRKPNRKNPRINRAQHSVFRNVKLSWWRQWWNVHSWIKQVPPIPQRTQLSTTSTKNMTWTTAWSFGIGPEKQPIGQLHLRRFGYGSHHRERIQQSSKKHISIDHSFNQIHVFECFYW